MSSFKRKLTMAAAVAAAGFSVQANATLILDTGIATGAGGFNPDAATTNTIGNSLPGVPGSLLFGQLYADVAGTVQFYYVGTEAAYTNTLMLNPSLVLSGSSSYSSMPGNNFTAPDNLIATMSVGAGQFLDFGFCTNGGDSVGIYGRCAYNDDASSLIAQYNYIAQGSQQAGYRSIAFRALDGYSSSQGLSGNSSYYDSLYTYDSNLWAVFWDDSGAKNDDNHDDFIAVLRFRPTSVPEPSTLLLMGLGMLGVAASRRRARK